MSALPCSSVLRNAHCQAIFGEFLSLHFPLYSVVRSLVFPPFGFALRLPCFLLPAWVAITSRLLLSPRCCSIFLGAGLVARFPCIRACLSATVCRIAQGEVRRAAQGLDRTLGSMSDVFAHRCTSTPRLWILRFEQ